MTVQCIACSKFSMRNAGKMAELGYGHCELERSAATFESATFERHCHTYDPADQDVVQKRNDWLDGKKQQFFKEVMSHVKT